MGFATELEGRDDHAAGKALLDRVTHWNQPQGRLYFMAPLRPNEHPLLGGCMRAYFLKVEPGGHIHRHTDTASTICETHLIVVETNDRCFVCWREPKGMERFMHLALGKRYRMNDRGLVHWAINGGDTDRVHLVIDYAK